MVSKELCEKIWKCHREIDASKELLKDLDEKQEQDEKWQKENSLLNTINQKFRADSKLEMGVPTGENSKRLYSLSLELAKPVISAHLANKQAELVELNEIAKLALLGKEPNQKEEKSLTGSVTYSINGVRRSLADYLNHLRSNIVDIQEQVSSDDIHAIKSDFNELACISNSFNCVHIKGVEDFDDLSKDPAIELFDI